jgi:hypothetical protein
MADAHDRNGVSAASGERPYCLAGLVGVCHDLSGNRWGTVDSFCCAVAARRRKMGVVGRVREGLVATVRSRVLARGLVVVATSVAAVLSVAAPGWSPKYILGASAFGDCHGDGVAASRFQGSFTVRSFLSSGGQLLADALVVGSCTAVSGDTVAVVPRAAYAFPVSLTTFCAGDDAGYEVRPGAAAVDGVLGDSAKDGVAVKMALDLAPTTVVDRRWGSDESSSVRARLCALHTIAGHRSPAELAQVLNVLALA